MNHPSSPSLSSWVSASGPITLWALWWIPSNLFCVEVSRTGQPYPRHSLTNSESRGITFSLKQVMPLFMPLRAQSHTTTSCTACFLPGLPGLIHSNPSISIKSSSFPDTGYGCGPCWTSQGSCQLFPPVCLGSPDGSPAFEREANMNDTQCSLPIYRSCHL